MAQRKKSKVNLDDLVVNVEGLDRNESVGSGAYGEVLKVTVNGRKCIAKRLHKILVQADNYYPNATTKQKEFIVTKFKEECCILSELNHPNVVSFVGVNYGSSDKNDINLVMEQLYSDLAKFISEKPDTDLSTKIHILYDVSKGLCYLHSLTPPLIHRDLTASNVLLTEDLTAKIGDLGMSRYVDPTLAAITLTTNPGNIYYMPPECRVEHPKYTVKLDIFSFGILIAHTIIGSIPNTFDLSSIRSLRYKLSGREELQRRKTSLQELGKGHVLYPLVEYCLHDKPNQRPPTEKLRRSLRDLCCEHPRMVSVCMHITNSLNKV